MNILRRESFFKGFLLIVGLAGFFGCSSGGGGACPATNLSLDVCQPNAGPFSLTIDNDFFPLVVNSQSVLESSDGNVRLEISVLDETEVVAGITTRVLEEREFHGGQIVEVSRNFFVQAPDRTVCYYGEQVDIFENGVVVNHEGSWRADGGPDNGPGIFMPGNPSVGMSYNQEVAPGVAEDQAEIQSMGDAITVPAGAFSDTLTFEDCNRLDGGKDSKVFVRGIGLAIDGEVNLVSF